VVLLLRTSKRQTSWVGRSAAALWLGDDRVGQGECPRPSEKLAWCRSSPWLFPAPKGAPRAPDNITKMVGRAVRKALGVPFSPHMMRYILATLLYRRDPHNGVVVQRKLRHSSLKTTERMYGVMTPAPTRLGRKRSSTTGAPTSGKNGRRESKVDDGREVEHANPPADSWPS